MLLVFWDLLEEVYWKKIYRFFNLFSDKKGVLFFFEVVLFFVGILKKCFYFGGLLVDLVSYLVLGLVVLGLVDFILWFLD